MNKVTFGLTFGLAFIALGIVLGFDGILMALGFGVLVGIWFGSEPDWRGLW